MRCIERRIRVFLGSRRSRDVRPLLPIAGQRSVHVDNTSFKPQPDPESVSSPNLVHVSNWKPTGRDRSLAIITELVKRRGVVNGLNLKEN